MVVLGEDQAALGLRKTEKTIRTEEWSTPLPHYTELTQLHQRKDAATWLVRWAAAEVD